MFIKNESDGKFIFYAFELSESISEKNRTTLVNIVCVFLIQKSATDYPPKTLIESTVDACKILFPCLSKVTKLCICNVYIHIFVF